MFLNKAVFLDRDGVLNYTEVRDGKPYAPTSVEDFKLFDDVEISVRLLKDAGFLLVVVTNQPDVGNGFVAQSVVDEMNSKLMNLLPIDAVQVCFHKQTDDCDCRKPKPGMLIESAAALNINLHTSFMVGDRKGDVIAGEAAGCRTVFIDNGYNEIEKSETADITVSSLSEAVKEILNFNPVKN